MIGVLNLQGGVQEHLAHLRRIGVPAKPVKVSADFVGLVGLIIPGGESTCLSRLLKIFQLDRDVVNAWKSGVKLWGTCAGAILLARENIGETAHLRLLDIAIQRNAFGSQLDSFQCSLPVPDLVEDPLPMTFIRAPKIMAVGQDVRVLLRLSDESIAAAEDDHCLVTVFHPELSPCLAFHRHFARKCGLSVNDDELLDDHWSRKDWMSVERV